MRQLLLIAALLAGVAAPAGGELSPGDGCAVTACCLSMSASGALPECCTIEEDQTEEPRVVQARTQSEKNAETISYPPRAASFVSATTADLPVEPEGPPPRDRLALITTLLI